MRLLTLAVLVVLTCAGSPAPAEPVGKVTRISGQAHSGDRLLALDSSIDSGAVLRTAADARLEVGFIDGTRLTLGAATEIAIDTYVFDPKAAKGDMLFRLGKGAALWVSGAVGTLPGKPLKVVSPVATIGIRGTTFWSGSLDNPLDVLVLDGAVSVDNPAGGIVLEAGQGTGVTSPDIAPGPPVTWGTAKVNRALAATAF